MKIRESGMPACDVWERFFDPEAVLQRLGLVTIDGDCVEFGCGYGTFTLPLAGRTVGTVHALDIDPAMVECVAARAARGGFDNIVTCRRDFMADGTGLDDGAAAVAILFNILHAENPVSLLGEARRNIAPGGRIAVMHWNYDPETPRGPPLAIRPLPQNFPDWAREAGLGCGPVVDLPPYHYGFVMQRPAEEAPH